ncbi:MAG TPA: IPT/TIG domain-containing protein [Phycisphaerae bacterium]|nr:IPT/TIG domain-containing protein [Phycisphaerae bacterium]
MSPRRFVQTSRKAPVESIKLYGRFGIVTLTSLVFAALLCTNLGGCPGIPPGAQTLPQGETLPLDVAITPTIGPTSGGTLVAILGSDLKLIDHPAVLFGAFLCTEVTVIDKSAMNVVTPPQAAGLVDVLVRRANGSAIKLIQAFEYVRSLPGGPRVVSAVSLSNTTVRVVFNEPVWDGTDDPSNYSIVQENVNPEVGALIVTGAVLSDDQMSVTLTTMSQNEVTYLLTVINVRDLDGTPLAPPELLVNPTQATFAGTPPAEDGVDTDGDGLLDNEEQRGWLVTVQLSNGQTHEREVTSSPLLVDTDDDGLTDFDEKRRGTDPRTGDTDADLIGDLDEALLWRSSPTNQDTDGDGLADSTELALETSPVIADTDGDQLTDYDEIIQRNRNPLISDLPLPQITVDEIRLDLKITSSYTDEIGVTHESNDFRSSSFTQSRTDTTGRSATKSTESENTSSQKIGGEVSYSVKDGFAGKVTAEASFGQRRTRGFSSTTNREQARTSQQEYQNSVNKALTESEAHIVTRTIDEAIIQANVNIANQSDIAFTITNLEIAVEQQDRRHGLEFRPIATLRPSGADDPMNQPSYNLGPFDPERGPIIFENVEVFPNLVDDLMREPTGLIFKVVNFDILDEFGRNFVFASQEANDRTAGITIDFGNGIVESYRVATNSQFDPDGLAIGISMQRALEIIGITKTPGDDQPFPPADPFEPLPPQIRDTYGTCIDDDGFERLTRIRGTQNDLVAVPEAEKRFWAIITSNTDLPRDVDFSTIQLNAAQNYLLLFTRDIDKDQLFEREEYLYGSDDRSEDTDGDTLGDYFEVRTGWTVHRRPGLPYMTFPSPAHADSDNDSLTDDVEYAAGTDPWRGDTDEDALLDAVELSEDIEIVLFDGDADDFNNPVITITPYSSWAIIDGGDGTADTTADPNSDDEQVVAPGQSVAPGDVVIAPGPNGVLDTTPAGDDLAQLADEIVKGPDPNVTTCETTAGGDDVQVVPVGDPASPYQVLIRAGVNGLIDTVPAGDDDVRVKHAGLFTTDPLNQDTDFDGIPDGREVLFGTNPNIRDADKVTDSDQDGLFDIEEEDIGWDVTVYDSAGSPTTVHVTSNKYKPDTDLDGVPDVFERAIGSNPRSWDTDGDTLFDLDEFDPQDTDDYYVASALMLAEYRCARAGNCQAPPVPDLADRLRTHVCKMDTDGDWLDDDVEVDVPWVVRVTGTTPRQVYSEPWSSDFDLDGLSDLEEKLGADGKAPEDAGDTGDATDPSNADTDGDTTNDDIEIDRASDPLTMDKYVRFTFVQIVCVNADDGAGGALDMYGRWFIRKGGTEFTVKTLHDTKFNTGTVLHLDTSYDFTIAELEAVVFGTTGVYDEDPPGDANDAFSNFTELISYDSVRSDIIVGENIESDQTSKFETTVVIEVIQGVPPDCYPPLCPTP